MKVNRKQTKQQAIDATGFTQYISKEVLESAPVGNGNDIEFFTLDKYITCLELEEEYAKRNVEPVDIYTLAQYVVDNPEYKEKHIGIQWKDADGNYCFAVFGCWRGERSVRVDQVDYAWRGPWWFPVRRK